MFVEVTDEWKFYYLIEFYVGSDYSFYICIKEELFGFAVVVVEVRGSLRIIYVFFWDFNGF